MRKEVRCPEEGTAGWRGFCYDSHYETVNRGLLENAVWNCGKAQMDLVNFGQGSR